ncbi:glycoside hydrolase family 26 protein [Lacihabitans soyangensis]|uniref:Mannan endo-1,4-beta-mannosidase n=1 Tax=Lacihabitans soyangensis TaxID=869394 RepID=A0AAE3KV62_9BACT|nr:glycosyl hydrolase [Lacihabitans soyangensis]MCP9765684.1 beta-mannosidase [Lacihabitans soyangensis]
MIKIILLIGIIFSYLMSVGQSDSSKRKEVRETEKFYKNLQKISRKGTMFGQQDALAYGLNADGSRWIGEKNRCDVKSVTGDYPAVIGFDLGHLELDSTKNLDGVPFIDIQQLIIETNKRGGIVTISWHLNNPLNPAKSTWDKQDSTIKNLFSNKEAVELYNSWLDKFSSFLKSLKDKNGKIIPIIFRPFHEHTGSWFWWGANQCTTSEYIALWQYTVNYLKNDKGLNSLIFAYSTDVFESEQSYLERYPGDKYVDLLGFDYYQRNAPASNEDFVKNMNQMIDLVKRLAIEKNKLSAITEMGLEKITESNWWTNIVFPLIKNQGLCYILLWRNGRPDHYYTPFKGHKSEHDFIKFYQQPEILFLNDIKKLKR